MKVAEMYKMREAMEEKDQLAEKIAILESARISPRVAAYDREPVRGSVQKDITAENLVKIERLLEMYNAKLALTLDMQERFEKACECLLARERKIMRKYFIDYMTWEKIASDEGISWTQIMRIRRECIGRITKC